MKLLKAGILMGIAVGVLYMSAYFKLLRTRELFLQRVYADETLSSAAYDALFFNEEIEGESNGKRAVRRFYESIEGVQEVKEGIQLLMFFADEGVYYGRQGEALNISKYEGRQPEVIAAELLTGLFEADLNKDPFLGASLKIEKGSFVVIYDNAGEKLAAIGGAKRKERVWNSH
ncbi:MAG: hypothetical protein J6Z02_08685 [Lachnospiraceae bacterium]|nr:hypothetical protein [Lachnospiraceae bacterium]